MAQRAALKPGDVLGVQAKDKELALFDLDGKLYATENTCTPRLRPSQRRLG